MIEQPIEELPLIFPEGEQSLQALLALGYKTPSPVLKVPGLLACLIAEYRDQLVLQFLRFKSDVIERDSSPVLPIHRTDCDEPTTQSCVVKIAAPEQGVGIEQIPAGMPSEQGRELPCGDLVDVEDRYPLGGEVAERA